MVNRQVLDHYKPVTLSEKDMELVRRMGIDALYGKPRLSLAHPGYAAYPYFHGGYLMAVADSAGGGCAGLDLPPGTSAP